MFEQSILIDHPTNKSWSVLVSLTCEITLVAAAALVPLLYTGKLPHFDWKTSVMAPPPRARPVEVARVSGSHAVTISPVSVRPLVYAPNTANHAHSAPVEVAMDDAPQIGVVGGTGDSSAISAVMGNGLLKAPPPKAPADKPLTPKPSSDPVRVSSGVQMAKLIHQVVPVYPALARTARVSGVVHLLGIIGRDGRIRSLQVIAAHPLLTQAAVDAVSRWIYKPTLLSNEPVEVIAPIDVVFTINQ
jgi:protein TonB